MQQQGGSPYGVIPSDMVAPPFSSSESGPRQPRMIGIPSAADYLQQQQPLAEAASPISSRPAPPHLPAASHPAASIFDELGSAVGAVGGSFADEEALGASEEGERGVGGGNRWPRQETLALLKIRSEMDAAFRDATLKGPLWEDVSRKLAELGYARSAKKCKEKFENVHKYYKRTKEGRAGRQDGKSYRFFSQLEALHSSNNAAATAPTSTSIAAFEGGSLPAPQPSARNQTIALPSPTAPPPAAAPSPLSRSAPELAPAAGISFSSSTSSSSASESDGEDTEEGGAGGLQDGSRKRKREGWHGGSRKVMAFFDGLMKQLMERQEAMQQRFLETIEKREQDRMIREEAWKRQEMARLNREYELMAQERTMAASRDAAVISFLQKFSGSSTPNQPPAAAAISSPAPLPQPSAAPAAPQHPTPQKHAAPATPGEVPGQPQPQLQPQPQPEPQPQPQPHSQPQQQPHSQPQLQHEANDNHESNDAIVNHLPALSEPSSAVVPVSDLLAEAPMVGGGLDIVSPSSSRWPKQEVLALIKLRSGLDTKYHEAGPKGPLWEEISLGMKRLSYNRSAKRCKEKWENINKYFKKVKESNKKRPEDAKTCPYFHELDALYRKKQIGGGAATAAAAHGIPVQQQQENTTKTNNPQQVGDSLVIPSQISGPKVHENNSGTKNQITIPRSNGGIPQIFFEETPNRGGGAAMKKPEDIVKGLMEQHNQPRRVVDDYDKFGGEPVDSDTANHEYDDEDDYDDDDDDDGKLRYEIQFQRPGVRAAAGGARSGSATGKVATAPASTAGSFLGMVQ